MKRRKRARAKKRNKNFYKIRCTTIDHVSTDIWPSFVFCFEDMDFGLMPYVLAYLGDCGSCTRRRKGSPETLLILYNFIRGLAAFMDLGSGTNQAHKKGDGTKKRKMISR